MRDKLVKIYLDDREADMVYQMAKEWNLPVSRYMRKILRIEAQKYGFEDANKFDVIYTERYNEVRHEDN